MSRSWHPLNLDAEAIEAIRAGRRTQVRKIIDAKHLFRVDLDDPASRVALMLRSPYGNAGHTLWSKESPTQRESGARLQLTVERIAVQRVQEMTDAEIRAEWAGVGFYPYEHLRRDWREECDRRHPRKGDTWDDNPLVWAITFKLREPVRY